MRFFGFELTRSKEKALESVGGGWRGWKDVIHEPFTGAWQRNMEEKREDLYVYPALYACLRAISTDIGKLPFLLKQRDQNGIWNVVDNPAYSPVLRKPNHFQTAQQFRESWMLSKLTHGNTYVLKQRDNRGVVVGLYVLDPNRVCPAVSDSGAVWYQLQTDKLSGLDDGQTVTVPASEIIHDRFMTLHHPLIGVPPVCAAYWPAAKNLKILRSAATFFGNNAQPGGILTAPAGMSDEDAAALKQFWDENYSGANSGRIAVLGADMKFTAFAMKSADSQLVEQMRYSDEQICQPFGVPPFKIGIGSIPAGMKIEAINRLYHADALSTHIEAMENLLDEALKITAPLGVEVDTDPLFRLDAETRSSVWTGLVKGGIATPNEARYQFDLKPLEGGDTVYMQQQDIPLEEARKNTIQQAPEPEPETVQEEEAAPEDQQRHIIAAINKAFAEVN